MRQAKFIIRLTQLGLNFRPFFDPYLPYYKSDESAKINSDVKILTDDFDRKKMILTGKIDFDRKN